MELLSVLWIAVLVVGFHFTTPRQRENLLLVMWGLMAIPCIYWIVRLVL